MKIYSSSRRFLKAFCGFLCFCMCFPLLSSLLFASETVEPTFKSLNESLSYEISTTVTSRWDKHANVDLSIRNVGTETIHNWHLTFNSIYNIENIWGASILERDDDGNYTISNASYNQDIIPGEEVTIGMTIAGDEEEITLISLSDSYLLNTKEDTVDSSLYEIIFEEYYSWDEGFAGAIFISPSVDLVDYSIKLNANKDFTITSGPSLTKLDDGSYLITNDPNNQNIMTGGIYQISVNGINTIESKDIAFELSNIEVSIVTLGQTLEEIRNEEESQEVATPTPTLPVTQEITPTLTPTVVEATPTGMLDVTPTEIIEATPTESVDITPSEDIEPTEDITPIPEIDYTTDSDEDGIVDILEELIGTDPNVFDSDLDVDNDGLTNLEEIELGTSPINSDSDFDELIDGEEVRITGTDPMKYDTDGGSIADGEGFKNRERSIKLY